MKVSIFILSAQLLFTNQTQAANSVASNCKKFESAVQSGTEARKLKKFLDIQWKYWMQKSPEFATYVGLSVDDDKWTDFSDQAYAESKQEELCQQKALASIKRSSLRGEEVVTYDISVKNLATSIEGQKFDGRYLVMDQLDGVHTGISDMMWNMPKNSVKDFENRISRLQKAPKLIEQKMALLKPD